MTRPASTLTPPMLTADLPGVGGRIRVELDDFEVDEVPAYPAAGRATTCFCASRSAASARNT